MKLVVVGLKELHLRLMLYFYWIFPFLIVPKLIRTLLLILLEVLFMALNFLIWVVGVLYFAGIHVWLSARVQLIVYLDVGSVLSFDLLGWVELFLTVSALAIRGNVRQNEPILGEDSLHLGYLLHFLHRIRTTCESERGGTILLIDAFVVLLVST